jgi:F-type H+-transporting ATPase subunit g
VDRQILDHSQQQPYKMSLGTKVAPLVSRVLTQAKPKLNTFMHYAKVEMTPPTPAEFPAVARGFGNLIRGARTGAYRNVTVRQALLNTLITVEVLCWFFVGECIGKRGIIGYDV